MNAEHLIRMANQIGTFFESQPDRTEALAGIASHLQKFWAPRMRRQLLALWDAGAAGISPMVREALAQHAPLLA